MNLEGKCCKPANETEYNLMKAVALAGGYEMFNNHCGYRHDIAVGINNEGEFQNIFSEEQITIHDWVFKATHKDTGKLVVPEWCNVFKQSDCDALFAFAEEPLTGQKCRLFSFESGEGYTSEHHAWARCENTILTRQPETEQTWYERGEFPPAGTWCQVDECGGWVVAYIIGVDAKGNCVYQEKGFSEYDCYDAPSYFRPMPKKSPRDEWVERACGQSSLRKRDGAETVMNEIYDALISGELEVPKKNPLD